MKEEFQQHFKTIKLQNVNTWLPKKKIFLLMSVNVITNMPKEGFIGTIEFTNVLKKGNFSSAAEENVLFQLRIKGFCIQMK